MPLERLHLVTLRRTRGEQPTPVLIQFLDPTTRTLRRTLSALVEAAPQRRLDTMLLGDEIVDVMTPNADVVVALKPISGVMRAYHGAHRIWNALRHAGAAGNSALTEPPGAPAFKVADPAPLASIIVPTRDRADLLERVVETCYAHTAYATRELIIVDNGSVEPSTFRLLSTLRERHGARIVRDDGAFNFSRLVNAGARAASGEMLAILNNDVEALSGDWLSRMIALAQQPDVGVVGAKLLYPHGAIQHAGIVLGVGGLVGHSGRHLPSTAQGRHKWLAKIRQASAVTGACMITPRAIFERLNGFDENYAIEFNDVDYCLRAAALGAKTLWTPWPTLMHGEGVTRGRTGVRSPQIMADQTRFMRQWGSALSQDPHFPPEVSRMTEAFPTH